ncbi:aspartate carbamoyltransferase [Facilibium subflavum]|uniref:aspartate carbamoyltransferase n=1 Tax=Facilibium subflavum TaxID=2219058 RepID=UPI000E647615|nr:aspartate carbamoyltransferase [Facilibium subflavum]
MNKHLVDINQLTKDDLNRLLGLAEKAKQGELDNTLNDKIIASCFFEASTRTRLSFETAIHRLGAKIIGFSDSRNTSFGQKGESLADTIYMLNAYADAIIMRHPEPQSALKATKISQIPVINAGDGANQHPTQTLLDLYTIQQKFKRIDGLKIAMVGDLKYGRTVHSLSYALTQYNDITIYYVAPDQLQIPPDIIDQLKQKNIQINFEQSLEAALPFVDVCYMTRLQKERFTDEIHDFGYVLTKALLMRYAQKHLIVMHPLPRVGEICESVDQTEHAWYFKQAKNGVYMRQALLYSLLHA